MEGRAGARASGDQSVSTLKLKASTVLLQSGSLVAERRDKFERQ